MHAAVCNGLSPRVRGRRSFARSIPTCAGQPPASFTSLHVPVYPHVCGAAREVLHKSGLSPRVRGRLTGPAVGVPLVLSIPTCAGQPASIPMRRHAYFLSAERVYPHVCGAAQATAAHKGGSNQHSYWGLSPRVRGSLPSRIDPHVSGQAALLLPSSRRSIPTCAGQTQRSPEGLAMEVYPHVCGAASNHTCAIIAGHRAGSIPTCAGQPQGDRSGAIPNRVYPHVCGAADDIVAGTGRSPSCSEGLSPRVRGSPGARKFVGAVGSIPTCAGQTR